MLEKAREIIVKCTNIQKLNLSNNKFTSQGFGILQALNPQNNCEIKELNVSGNKIRSLKYLGHFISKAHGL